MSRIFDGLGFAALIVALFALPYVLATVAFIVLFPICWVAETLTSSKSDAPAEKQS